MNWTLVLLAVLAVVVGQQGLVGAARPGPVDKEREKDPLYHWAVLIAGSQGWWNYRHQADVCHAYQLLRENGLPEDRIIVMVYDDLASSVWNPYPGKLFNKPGGQDVYKGCAKDYTGNDVQADTFLAVLSGNETAVKGLGSERVLKSEPHERVFVYYSDHGATGILAMPSGRFLFADELVALLKEKAAKEEFKELVFYVEACESGSMFEGLLPSNISVYAMTAANASESSWAVYCPEWYAHHDDYKTPNASALGTCMGDLFSVAFLEDTEKRNIATETLHEQYEHVKFRTSNNLSYKFGSHVEEYGAKNITVEVTGDFLGTLASITMDQVQEPAEVPRPESAVQQRDGELVHLMHRVLVAGNAADQQRAMDDLGRELARRELIDTSIRNAVRSVVFERKAPGIVMNSADEATVDVMMIGNMGRPRPGVPVVDDWDCLRGFVDIWESECGKMDSYASQHTRVFANLCNTQVSFDDFAGAVARSGCQGDMAMYSEPTIVVS